jgi:hypothetical protein
LLAQVYSSFMWQGTTLFRQLDILSMWHFINYHKQHLFHTIC